MFKARYDGLDYLNCRVVVACLLARRPNPSYEDRKSL